MFFFYFKNVVNATWNSADLIEVKKVVHGLSAIPFEILFEFDTNSRKRGHSLKLRKKRCQRDLRLYFFRKEWWHCGTLWMSSVCPVSYTHLRAHETGRNLVCRLLLEKKRSQVVHKLSLIHIWRCRRIERCRSRWSPYH